MTNNAIEAEGLTKRFGRGSTSTQALAGIDLVAREGSVLGVLGPNGAGKTTAVRIMATLIRADAGQATVAGYDVVRDAQQVRQHIGLTGQYASVDEDLTGTENLMLIGELLNLRRPAARPRAGDPRPCFSPPPPPAPPPKPSPGGMPPGPARAASLVGRPA